MSVQIRIIVGPSKGSTIELSEPRTLTLGRDPESDVVLPAANASRNHAHVIWDGERLLIEDLDSRNGVYVNANRIEKSCVLGTGDVVELGGCVFSVQAAKSAAEFSYRKTINLDEDEELMEEGGAKDTATATFNPSDPYEPDANTVNED